MTPSAKTIQTSRRSEQGRQSGRPDEADERLHAALKAFPARVRPGVLRFLELPDDKRAEAIGQLHREGVTPTLVELLIDLEEEPALSKKVLTELRRMVV